MRIAALLASLPFVVAASPGPSADPSPVPADDVALPAAAGSWIATVTVAGGRIARFRQYVVASDGHASSTPTGAIVLDATGLAPVAAAVAESRDTAWSIPRESTCCDRVVTRVTLAHRGKHARIATFTAQAVEAGTLLPVDAGTLARTVEAAFEANATAHP
jgi:hypothetical protein